MDKTTYIVMTIYFIAMCIWFIRIDRKLIDILHEIKILRVELTGFKKELEMLEFKNLGNITKIMSDIEEIKQKSEENND